MFRRFRKKKKEQFSNPELQSVLTDENFHMLSREIFQALKDNSHDKSMDKFDPKQIMNPLEDISLENISTVCFSLQTKIKNKKPLDINPKINPILVKLGSSYHSLHSEDAKKVFSAKLSISISEAHNEYLSTRENLYSKKICQSRSNLFTFCSKSYSSISHIDPKGLEQSMEQLEKKKNLRIQSFIEKIQQRMLCIIKLGDSNKQFIDSINKDILRLEKEIKDLKQQLSMAKKENEMRIGCSRLSEKYKCLAEFYSAISEHSEHFSKDKIDDALKQSASYKDESEAIHAYISRNTKAHLTLGERKLFSDLKAHINAEGHFNDLNEVINILNAFKADLAKVESDRDLALRYQDEIAKLLVKLSPKELFDLDRAFMSPEIEDTVKTMTWVYGEGSREITREFPGLEHSQLAFASATISSLLRETSQLIRVEYAKRMGWVDFDTISNLETDLPRMKRQNSLRKMTSSMLTLGHNYQSPNMERTEPELGK